MNDLSWLLYFADIADNLSGILRPISFVLITVSILMGLFLFPVNCEADKEFKLFYTTLFKNVLIATAIVSIVSSVIPSKETLYAIAVSEVGEEVVKSETANKAVKALNTWLDRQIQPEETGD